ncbi:alpha/beta-hydrolase [Marasmius fiardii PR-910]|nr:alpha/beta-hydrolase [Marasmius fiardii PR-910]
MLSIIAATLYALVLSHLALGKPVEKAILEFPYQHVLRRPGPSSSFQTSPISHLSSTVTLKARLRTVYRTPSPPDALIRSQGRFVEHSQSEILEWNAVDVLGPDIEDRHTLAQLARMSGNAYALPGQKNWYDLDGAWNKSFPVKWENPEDGFRGHVFLSADNSTVILSIKGTTLQGPTSKKDKFNDNLLFSCCCARVDFTWIFRTVCDCYMHSHTCDNTCLSKALIQDSLFYSIGVDLVNDLLLLYPQANLWLIGHSLGGALASLLGSTYGLPAVAFESPGERLAAERLHLPLPPPSLNNSSSVLPVTHIYHTADPIPQGACSGFYSPCAQAGYALETRCHLGKSIVFDTVKKLKWAVDVRTHPIKHIINLLEADDITWGDGRDVPEALEEKDCTDCSKWRFSDDD